MNENMVIIKDLLAEIDSASQGMSTKYSQADMETKLRGQFVELFGTENPSYLQIARNPNAGQFYAIMEEVLEDATSRALTLALPYAEYKNANWGDSPRFEVENTDMFDVVTIASGNFNIRRQRLDSKFFTIATEAKGIKIFDSFKRFLAGRVNWAQMIQKVANSYVKHVRELTWTALYASAPVNGNAVFNVNDAGGFDIESVYTMAEHVGAENMNSDVIIMGSRQALRNMAPIIATEEANTELHKNGYYTTAEGYKLVPVDQMHKTNTFEFLLSNKQLMVLPADVGAIVKILEEGTPIITDKGIGETMDGSVEHMFYKEVGVAVVTGRKYGKYTFA